MTLSVIIKMEGDIIKPSSRIFSRTENTTWRQLGEPSHSLGKAVTVKGHHPEKENQKKLARWWRSLWFERRDDHQSTLREPQMHPFRGTFMEWSSPQSSHDPDMEDTMEDHMSHSGHA